MLEVTFDAALTLFSAAAVSAHVSLVALHRVSVTLQVLA